MLKTNLKTVPLKDVRLGNGLLGRKNELIRKEVLPYQWKALNNEIPGADQSSAVENFRIAAGEARGKFTGMVFQDSDLYKWLEAVAYTLATHPEKELEDLADSAIDLIEKAQQPDGYLNTYFTIAEPEKRWTNLAECHELYCAGHLIEAAVAYYQATGKRKLLDVAVRFADHIDDKFGPDPGKLRGYPGHQEIELALVKLYEVTGEERYLRLARYFLEERGREPHYFDLEWEKRGRTGFWPSSGTEPDRGKEYFQAHKPVLDQEAAVGHAVRALYMYSAMADVAGYALAGAGDGSWLAACRKLWENVTKKQMYITGGVGSDVYSEAFTFDYDLPDDTAYAETCAAIALVFFAWRMLQLQPAAEYADVMERALYNGVLSGMAEDGKSFFYVNPLAVHPETCTRRYDHRHVKPVRQKWFGCACCPPNLARLFASIGSYIYLYNNERIYVNLYTSNTARFRINGREVALTQETGYPWEEKVRIAISSPETTSFTLALRLPGWCRRSAVSVNGEEITLAGITENGYALIDREWKDGDTVELALPMPVEKMAAHPGLRENAGKIALQRGPVVYCLEEVDNGKDLHNLVISPEAEFTAEFADDFPGRVVVLKGEAFRTVETGWGNELYRPFSLRRERVKITAVPYYAWANRRPGEMRVWLRVLERE